MLIGKFDWQVDPASKPGEPWSRCLDMVWRAAEAGSDRLNFVPTHHWLGNGGSASSGIAGYCYMEHTDPADSSSGSTCRPWSEPVITEYRSAMTLCFTEAMRQGMTLYVRPHLDDGTANGAWRNGLLLQPEAKHSGYSYYDIMLAPIADALRDSLAAAAAGGFLRTLPGQKRPHVYFAMQGEMSATIMRFAGQWAGIIPRLRDRVGNAHADIKMGVGLNFNRLDDTSSVTKTYDSSRLSWLAWMMGVERGAADAPPIDANALRSLLSQQLDFVGISAYAPYTGSGMALSEFENAAFMFGNEMRDSYGINVLGLVSSGKLELQYSEFGLGGGGSYGGGQVARSPGEVALRPFFGIYGPYNPASDPWSIPSNRAFLREFYSKALAWLADPGNKTYKVASVFIWSMASWDVLGVYPESITSSGSYRDPAIAGAIASYNRQVVAAQGGASVGGSASAGSVPAAGK
ncbi:hypothetical protein OEZ86_007066 [Tetradesmus obliquus]|nr:hypothetical protein OEZ86_007066 [Tetradesmus obliquus]